MTSPRWTITAIKQANTDAGFFFFSPDTLRFFHDTPASFSVEQDGDAVYVVRKRAGQNADGFTFGQIGDRRRFNIYTGAIGPVIRRD